MIGGVKALKLLFASLLGVLLSTTFGGTETVNFGNRLILRNRFCKISVGWLALGLWGKVEGSLRVMKIMCFSVITGVFPQVFWFSWLSECFWQVLM